MNEIPNIITERVDDIPLLLEQMQRMELPTLIDTHFPAHGNWYGLSLGWGSTIWLSAIVSRGDHRLVHVEPWGANRLFTLQTVTGQDVERLDFTDDRLESVLRHLSDDNRWGQFESRLNQHTVRVYDLSPARIHVDSTTASAYASVSPEGLFQFGHSKDYRPDLPQVKVMQAVLDPLAGSFSFREWDCTMALKGVKSLVPRGAMLARHAPHEPNPFPQVNTHDNTASAAHRGVRRDSGLSPLSWETPSLARHSLLGLLCDVVWVSDL